MQHWHEMGYFDGRGKNTVNLDFNYLVFDVTISKQFIKENISIVYHST